VETARRSRRSPTITRKAGECRRAKSSPHFANALFERGMEIEDWLKGNVRQMTIIQVVV
jgi:hypothetical protein